MKYTITHSQSILEALALLSPQSSKTTLRSWLKEERIRVDGQTVKLSSTLVNPGQEIVLGTRPHYLPGGMRLLYEDQYLLVIDKPSGLLTVSTAFEKDETAHALLKDHYHPKKIYVVHRLDQDTSGVMMFVFSEEALEILKKDFEQHLVERLYVGVVEGNLTPMQGKWESYLYEDKNYVVKSISNPTFGAHALTHYTVEGYSKYYTKVHFKLETGRKNQIRVHCSEAGHPIVGDKKYGSKNNVLKRLGLHAHSLMFTHPITKKSMKFESPIPDPFNTLFEQT